MFKMCRECVFGVILGLCLGSSAQWQSHNTISRDPNIPDYYARQMPHEFGPRHGSVDDPVPPDRRYPVRHAGLPLHLKVYPLPLKNSDHELNFNVSWQHSPVSPAMDYSLEVRSITDTADCRSPMCYEYNIPGERTWWLIPAFTNSVAETCAVRPGCTYTVRLIPHPWDGHTSANLLVELDECVANVCSCAHAPRLAEPVVSARTVRIQDDMFANISWSLPPPKYPQRLPPGLGKKGYIISIGKQMVSDAHPAPWFANTISRHVDTDGLVIQGDGLRWMLLPVNERAVERGSDHGTGRSDVRKEKKNKIDLPDVKLLARVNLIDDRGCVGPAGNATAFNPDEGSASQLSFGTYAIFIVLGGAWIMGAVFILSARVLKHVLKSFRSAPVSAPPEIVCRRPAWFPLQARTGEWNYWEIMRLDH